MREKMPIPRLFGRDWCGLCTPALKGAASPTSDEIGSYEHPNKIASGRGTPPRGQAFRDPRKGLHPASRCPRGPHLQVRGSVPHWPQTACPKAQRLLKASFAAQGFEAILLCGRRPDSQLHLRKVFAPRSAHKTARHVIRFSHLFIRLQTPPS